MRSDRVSAVRSAVLAISGSRARWLDAARRRGLTSTEADDALQRALLRAIERTELLREPERAAAWLSRILRNELNEALRRRDCGPSLDPDALAAPSIEEDPCHCVLAQLQGLPQPQRSVLQWIAVDGATLGEVARRLGVSANAAGVRYFRARAALRQRLEAHCGTTTARSCVECGCAERGCCPPST